MNKSQTLFFTGHRDIKNTEELREFLQRYVSNSGYFFADGEGKIETDSNHPINADEWSQWLFACGYYQ